MTAQTTISLGREHAEADAADVPAVLDERRCPVLAVKHEPRDILLGHARQLVRFFSLIRLNSLLFNKH